MSILYAIDPGTEQSAIVMLAKGRILGHVYSNEEMVQRICDGRNPPGHVVIEEIASYGMPVGREVFQTVFWAGRFAEAWTQTDLGTWSLLPRRAVKLALCGSMKAKDSNIWQAIVDRYGGKDRAIGKKSAPGPLYGIRSHCRAALAVALTYQDQQAEAR